MAKDFDKYSIARVIFGTVLAIVFVLVLYRVYAARDFELSTELECDPAEESCFTRLCEEDCEEDKEYYKLQTMSARFASTCDPHFDECPEVDCAATSTCVETLCAADSVPEGEWCTDPTTYQPESDDVASDEVDPVESGEPGALDE